MRDMLELRERETDLDTYLQPMIFAAEGVLEARLPEDRVA